MPTKMRAVLLTKTGHPTENFELKEIEAPEPGEHDAVIEVGFIWTETGSDCAPESDLLVGFSVTDGRPGAA